MLTSPAAAPDGTSDLEMPTAVFEGLLRTFAAESPPPAVLETSSVANSPVHTPVAPHPEEEAESELALPGSVESLSFVALPQPEEDDYSAPPSPAVADAAVQVCRPVLSPCADSADAVQETVTDGDLGQSD
jgi:hypothetical protein